MSESQFCESLLLFGTHFYRVCIYVKWVSVFPPYFWISLLASAYISMCFYLVHFHYIPQKYFYLGALKCILTYILFCIQLEMSRAWFPSKQARCRNLEKCNRNVATFDRRLLCNLCVTCSCRFSPWLHTKHFPCWPYSEFLSYLYYRSLSVHIPATFTTMHLSLLTSYLIFCIPPLLSLLTLSRAPYTSYELPLASNHPFPPIFPFWCVSANLVVSLSCLAPSPCGLVEGRIVGYQPFTHKGSILCPLNFP